MLDAAGGFDQVAFETLKRLQVRWGLKIQLESKKIITPSSWFKKLNK